jgi:hypothetical protein
VNADQPTIPSDALVSNAHFWRAFDENGFDQMTNDRRAACAIHSLAINGFCLNGGN